MQQIGKCKRDNIGYIETSCYREGGQEPQTPRRFANLAMTEFATHPGYTSAAGVRAARKK